MFDLSHPEVQFAMDVVRQASLVAREVQDELVIHSLTKDDRSPVTVADFAVQALIAHQLLEQFPDATLVAEEDSDHLRTDEAEEVLDRVVHYVAERVPETTREGVCGWIDHGGSDPCERFWTLDPIDGTKGFLRGDQYAVCLALIVNGQVEIGLMGCPNLCNARNVRAGGPGTLVVAVRGQGAWHRPIVEDAHLCELQVSDQTDVSQMRLLRSVESAHTNKGRISQVAQEMGVEAAPIGMDSQAKYAVLASGKGHLLLRLLTKRQPDYEERIWDQAAGSLVVEEAGGRITDLNGKPLDFSVGRTLAKNRGVCASNGPFHDLVIAKLAEVQGPA
jgi:HAL2 family 3'(2'),5'-bisphosphate nucleotidase